MWKKLCALFGFGTIETALADMPDLPTHSASPPIPPPHDPIATVIGVSGSKADSKSVSAMMTLLRSQGAIPVFLANHEKRNPEEDFQRLDGVVIMGNDADIDPKKYGQQPHEKTKIETDEFRANYEEALIHLALTQKKPLFAVCGGMQRLNVMDGGTLHQHVPDVIGHSIDTQGDVPPFIPVQCIETVPGSSLATLLGNIRKLYAPAHQDLPDGVFMDNSFHHQAVDVVGSNFQASATSSDGKIIEAIEPRKNGKYAGQYVAGVQWHPEFCASEVSAKLVGNFAAHVAEYALIHPDASRHSEYSAMEESAISGISVSQKITQALLNPSSSWMEYVINRPAGAIQPGLRG